MTSLKLYLLGISDRIIRDNFLSILKYFRANTQLIGFRHVELTFTVAVTNEKVPHSLGFRPKDVVQTFKTGAGTLTWNYDKFNSTSLDITTTGPCVVRAYIGTHKEGIE